MSTSSWKTVFDSVRGTSHVTLNVPCQDACRVVELTLNDESWLVACVADGAGSASHADQGAELACDMFVSLVRRDWGSTLTCRSVTREDILAWLTEIRQSMAAEANRLEVDTRQLACTLIGSIIGNDVSCFIQIGDGAIAKWNGTGYETVFWPQAGEYAGTTSFLTDDRFTEYVDWKCVEGRIDEVALFSDGLERLVLRFAERSVHSPFLEPLFVALRQAQALDDYFAALRAFLDSPRINDRTDDDKTLILATRLS